MVANRIAITRACELPVPPASLAFTSKTLTLMRGNSLMLPHRLIALLSYIVLEGGVTRHRRAVSSLDDVCIGLNSIKAYSYFPFIKSLVWS